MGRLYRLRQYQIERMLFRFRVEAIEWDIEAANDILASRTAWDIITTDDPPPPDPGYRETELGELKSTIRNLAEHEIMDRMMARAMHEIHPLEDRHVFASIAATLLAAPPV